MMHSALSRALDFSRSLGISTPILLAPMAGACPVALSAAVANAGGLGACGALLMAPDQIADWARQMRATCNGGFQINLWCPDPPPRRDPDREAEWRRYLSRWGPAVPPEAADAPLHDFDAQFRALLDAGPTAISSIMGVYPPEMVREMKSRGSTWVATVTTVAEARAACDAGADVLVVQGMEAGGHRGAFQAEDAAQAQVGLFSLLPAVVDAVEVPVVATGGLADARGIAAALLLGASAVQIGTGFLRTPEAALNPAWAAAIAGADPEDTITTAAFSGRLGRAIRTAYAGTADAPAPAAYPVQRALTGPMRAAAAQTGNIDAMQAWAGQSARLAAAEPAQQLTVRLWQECCALLDG